MYTLLRKQLHRSWQRRMVRRFTRRPVQYQRKGVIIRRPVAKKPTVVKQRSNIMGFLGNTRMRTQRVLRGQSRQRKSTRRQRVSYSSHSENWRGMGARLTHPLVPNRELFDVFDKTVRMNIVRSYFGKHPMITHEIPIPSQLMPMFAISIRPSRFENLQTRLGPWAKHLTHWPGTNGELLDKLQMVRERIVTKQHLKRGEIGCYDSHVRLWKHVVENHLPRAFIMEDDANIQYGQETVNRINQLFGDLDKLNVAWDVIYVGHNNYRRPVKQHGCIGVPASTQGLFAYLVSQSGAQKLLQNALPMNKAVDDYVFMEKSIRQVTLEPRLCWVVDIEQSDTASIA